METDSDKLLKKKIKKQVVLWFRRIYVIIFHLYAWFWLFRLIFMEKSTNYEDYIIWFLTTTGVYFFVLDGKDSFLKEINNVGDLEND
ncbi:MAG: hypothetical protein AB7O47_07200 [Flavobacteriales bacterium]